MKFVVLCLALVALAGCGGSGGGSATPAGSGTPGAASPADSAEAKVRAAVEGYLKALGRGDAVATCEAFSERSREDIATFGLKKLKSRETCADAMRKLLVGQPGNRLKALGSARVLTVEVSGDSGNAKVTGLDTPIGVVREGAAWRILSQPTGKKDF